MFITATNAAFVFDDQSEQIDLTRHIGFFEDKTQKLSIEKIKLQNFVFSNKSTFSLGYTNSNFWLKTQFEYSSQKTQDFVFTLEIPNISKVEFYLFNQNNELIKQLKTGTETTFDTREDHLRHYIFTFSPQKNQKYTLFALAHNDYGVTFIPLRLQKKEAFMKFYQKEVFLFLLFFGLLIVSIFITIALFIIFKDKIYLYYGIYIFTVMCSRSAIFGFFFQYIHPDNPAYNHITKIVFVLLMAIAFINFVPLMLSSQKVHFPKVQKFFYFQSVLYFLFIIYDLSPLKNLIYTEINQFLINFINFNFVISIVFVLVIIVKALKQNYTPAKYFAFAITPLVIIVLCIILTNYLIINFISIFRYYGFEIGFSFEIILLFVALVNRYKFILEEQKQDYENKLIEFKKQLQKPAEQIEKYQHSKYAISEITENHKLLKAYMQLQKPYLNAEINLTTLADQLNIHHNLLSQVINQVENKNFFDYINSYRIEEAKAMLRNPKFNSLSVEGIGYECGFNTKATFYATFKKLTGFTPAEYKKSEMVEI